MLTGELPIGRFAPPSQKTPVDTRVDEVVFRTLEREREKRYSSVDEVKTQVESIRGTPPPASTAVPPVQESPPPFRLPPPAPARRWSMKANWWDNPGGNDPEHGVRWEGFLPNGKRITEEELQALSNDNTKRFNSGSWNPTSGDLQAFLDKLAGADLSGGGLRALNLKGLNLSGTKLTGADLSFADLTFATMTNTDLSHANLNGVTLVKPQLPGALLTDIFYPAGQFSGANLKEANLA